MSLSFIRDQPYISKDRAINLSFPDLVTCGLCQGILWLPVECTDCEKACCTPCFKNWKLETSELTRCPYDCPQYIERSCPITTIRILELLKITCRNQSNGCTEVLPYKRLETHEEVCDFLLKTCTGCQRKFTRKRLAEHEKQCPSVSLACSECGTVYQRCEKLDHTESKCLRVQIKQLRADLIETEQIQMEKYNEMLIQLRNFKEANNQI